MAEKRYYWLKLQQKFFDNPEIKILRRVSGGDTYTLIYLEMLLLSLDNNGYLYFEHYGENMADELAAVLNERKEDVSMLLNYLQSHNLITVSKDTYYLNNIKEMIGSEAGNARRMRKLRQQKKAQKKSISTDSPSQSDKRVTERDTDIELEKDIELDTDTHTDKEACVSNSDVQDEAREFFTLNIFPLFGKRTNFDLAFQAYYEDKLEGATDSQIIAELKNRAEYYRINNTQQRYMINPKVYFEERHYTDELDLTPPPPRRQQSNSATPVYHDQEITDDDLPF